MSIFASSYINFYFQKKELKYSESKQKDLIHSIENYTTVGKIIRLVLNTLTFGYVDRTFDFEVNGKNLSLNFSSLIAWLEAKSAISGQPITLSKSDYADHAKVLSAIKACLHAKIKQD